MRRRINPRIKKKKQEWLLKKIYLPGTLVFMIVGILFSFLTVFQNFFHRYEDFEKKLSTRHLSTFIEFKNKDFKNLLEKEKKVLENLEKTGKDLFFDLAPLSPEKQEKLTEKATLFLVYLEKNPPLKGIKKDFAPHALENLKKDLDLSQSQKIHHLTVWENPQTKTYIAQDEDVVWFSSTLDSFEKAFGPEKLYHHPEYKKWKKKKREPVFSVFLLNNKVIQIWENVAARYYPILQGFSHIFPATGISLNSHASWVQMDIQLLSPFKLPDFEPLSSQGDEWVSKDNYFFIEGNTGKKDVEKIKSLLTSYPPAILVGESLLREAEKFMGISPQKLIPLPNQSWAFWIDLVDSQNQYEYGWKIPEEEKNLLPLFKNLQSYFSPKVEVRTLSDDSSLEVLTRQDPSKLFPQSRSREGKTYQTFPESLIQKAQISWFQGPSFLLITSHPDLLERSLVTQNSTSRLKDNLDYAAHRLDLKKADIIGFLNLSKIKNSSAPSIQLPPSSEKHIKEKEVLSQNFRTLTFGKKSYSDHWTFSVFLRYR